MFIQNFSLLQNIIMSQIKHDFYYIIYFFYSFGISRRRNSLFHEHFSHPRPRICNGTNYHMNRIEYKRDLRNRVTHKGNISAIFPVQASFFCCNYHILL